MYRPPENNNKVKSIRSKFENFDLVESNKKIPVQNGAKKQLINGAGGGGGGGGNTINIDKLRVSRQLSDPQKQQRNIKRTPAFRLDKNVLEKNYSNNTSYTVNNRVKQLNSALKNCDKADNFIDNDNKTDDVSDENKFDIKITNNKPILQKSKSSHDFIYLRSKFDRKQIDESIITDDKQYDRNQRINRSARHKEIKNKEESTTVVDVTQLYTEPIPKLFRLKIKEDTHLYPSDIHKTQTLKLTDKKISNDEFGLTDTLKTALQRPLPPGPAPQKPPRTFEHFKPLETPTKNNSFLHTPKEIVDNLKINTITHNNSNTSPKKDPRYMLNKLELALRNNKIKTTKQNIKIEEPFLDHFENTPLMTIKSRPNLPSLPSPVLTDYYSTNLCSKSFNCLHGLTLKSNYEKIKEPNSSFFVDRNEEPVYDEPFHYNSESRKRDADENSFNKNIENRNSLYYMSTSLLYNEDNSVMDSCPKQSDIGIKQQDQKQMLTSENSSLSSFTSDLDSATSGTPLEETKTMETSLKIKTIIDKFETKNQPQQSDNKQLDLIYNSANRVEDLKVSLQRTLDRCFAHNNELKDNNNTSNSDSEEKDSKVSVDKMINKFQTYVKTMPKYRQWRKTKENNRLFYCCLIVGWNLEAPQIKLKFPSNAEIPPKIEDLCFPEAAQGPLDTSNYAQCYSLLITNDKGERTFGYCRRVIPEGSTNCLPLAYCILSKHRAPRFYKRILTELESRHGLPDKLRDKLINEFYSKKFPKPGESIKIDLTHITDEYLNRYVSNSNGSHNNNHYNLNNNLNETSELDLTSFMYVNGGGEYGTLNKVKKTVQNCEKSFLYTSDGILPDSEKTELVLTLHHDSRYEEADLKILHQLPNHILLKVFASLLLERKVILISCVLSKLSHCVDALQSILYPFSWPHTFIPILPKCLWDVVESPTPVVCGVLSVQVVNEFNIEHGIVIDLDERCILIKEGDEDSILSTSMKKAWEQAINVANSIPPDDYVHSVYLSDAYIKVFIVCLKNYKSFIADGDFQKEAFIKSGKTKGVRRFLKWFTETTMFCSFIETAINNSQCLNLFNQKMEMYGSEDSDLILNKLLEWKR